MEAENMTYEDLKDITEGLILRTITPIASPELPRGSFDWLSFPFGDFDVSDSPMVHFYDVITGYSDPIDWVSLGKAYKDACEKHDLQLLPQPFGLKKQVSGNVQLQMVILKDAGGNHAILKHLAFPDKIKPSMVKQLVFGDPRRAKWMQQNPKIGRKVLQYCLEGLGGRQFKAFELSNMATRKGAKPVLLMRKVMLKLMPALTSFSSAVHGPRLKISNLGGKPKPLEIPTPQSMGGPPAWLTRP